MDIVEHFGKRFANKCALVYNTVLSFFRSLVRSLVFKGSFATHIRAELVATTLLRRPMVNKSMLELTSAQFGSTRPSHFISASKERKNFAKYLHKGRGFFNCF